MSNNAPASASKPPTQHELALMIWLAVAPTLLIINIVLGPMLTGIHVVPRTLIVVTLAVPIVIYGLMPQLHKLRHRLLSRRVAVRS